MSDDPLTIEHSISILAPPERVWKFLTEPAHVSQWLGCMRYEKAVGHVFYMQQDAQKRHDDDIEGATHCEILALEEPSRFSFSWYLPGTPATEVHIHLQSTAEGTRVTLVHEGWDQFDAGAIRDIRDALAGGWKSFVLPALKQITEHER
ncbi:MAG: SRPBCC domain-containing protein, partial [Xanthomonadales bacterium]|nr:SRPBCC domain-containing protein [Xanthomonadales bacterium]